MTSQLLRPSDALALHHDTVREVLPNGLTLLVRVDRSAPVVSIVTHVKAGYFDESDDIVGIAHVLEHMYFKGTPTRGVGQIARETKANGGYLNAHTIYDHTSYYTVLPSSSFVAGLDIQFDAYARSVIDAEELARELEVIIQEAKRKRDTASAVTIETLYALLHDRHRIRRWRIGEEQMLRGFTREQLVAFYRRWYRPDNTILCVVGDVSVDDVRREVVARYGPLEAGTPPRDRGPMERITPGFRHREWSGDIAPQHTAYGWRVPGLAHPDAAALDLTGVAMGSGRASRLYRALRERQLASSVSAWNYTTDAIGVFVLHAEGPPAQARAAAQALWRELDALRQDGFRASEVQRAQRILEARWLRRLESMDGQAQYLASWEAEGGLVAASQYYDALMTLDRQTLQRVVNTHLDAGQVSVVSYRPEHAEPLASDAEGMQALLAEVVGQGSAVMSAPSLPTPPGAAVVEAPAVHTPGSSASCAAGATTEAQHDVHVFHTRGGVPILVHPRAGAPLVHLGLFQRGGAVLDAAEEEGRARLMLQSTLKGTRRRSGAQIAEAAEDLGSSISVSAGLESLGWALSVPLRHLTTAGDLLAEVVQEAAFPADGVETERAQALSELARLRDDMYRWPMRLASQAVYGTHPYARSTIGSETSLAALDASTLAAAHATQVMQGQTVLAVVGDVDPERTAAQLDAAFASLVYREQPWIAAAPWPQEVRREVDSRDKQQTALALLFPGPSRTDTDRYATRVLSSIASGLGGRFFEQLRDAQSLAYTVSAFPIERSAVGAFAAYIATSPTREEEAREGLLREFARFVEAPPSEEEMERARRYLLGTQAIAQQSGGHVLADLVDAWLFGDGLGEAADERERLAAVQAADVQRVAAHYFDPQRVGEGVVRGTG